MKVEISNLTFKCIVGILDFERVKKQKVVINLSFEYDFENNSFIDYAEVSKLIEQGMKKEKFKLLEDAIIYFENLLNKKYKIQNLNIKISKPNIIKNCVVSISS